MYMYICIHACMHKQTRQHTGTNIHAQIHHACTYTCINFIDMFHNILQTAMRFKNLADRESRIAISDATKEADGVTCAAEVYILLPFDAWNA